MTKKSKIKSRGTVTASLQLNNNSSFTLLELLFAMFLVSIISALTWGVFSRTFLVKDKIESTSNIYHETRVSLNRLTNEISQAFIKPANENPNIIFLGEDNGNLDKLRFNSFSHFRYIQDSKESDSNVIEFFVEASAEGKQNLFRREKFVIDDEASKGGDSFVLAENVTEFDLKYCDGTVTEWKNDWDTTKIEFLNRLPLAVLISLKIKDGVSDNEIHFRTMALVEWQHFQPPTTNIIEKGCTLE